MANQYGIVGVHLLHGQTGSAPAVTSEARLRTGPDQTADVVLLVELADAAFLPMLRRDGPLSDADLYAAGAGMELRRGAYRLQFSLVKDG